MNTTAQYTSASLFRCFFSSDLDSTCIQVSWQWFATAIYHRRPKLHVSHTKTQQKNENIYSNLHMICAKTTSWCLLYTSYANRQK